MQIQEILKLCIAMFYHCSQTSLAWQAEGGNKADMCCCLWWWLTPVVGQLQLLLPLIFPHHQNLNFWFNFLIINQIPLLPHESKMSQQHAVL